MVVLSKTIALVAVFFSACVIAHPGHDAKAEISQRAAYFQNAERRSLAHCADKLRERGLAQRSIARRQAMVERLRQKRSLDTRDFRKALNTSHHSSKNYTSETPPGVVFAGNSSCILSPEVTEGPYCKSFALLYLGNHKLTFLDVSGELIRKNVVEKEPGVPLTYEVQVLDVTTCEPLTGVLLEMWHCNSTVGLIHVGLLKAWLLIIVGYLWRYC